MAKSSPRNDLFKLTRISNESLEQFVSIDKILYDTVGERLLDGGGGEAAVVVLDGGLVVVVVVVVVAAVVDVVVVAVGNDAGGLNDQTP